MRFYGLLAIFLMFTQASQASPGSIFDSLVEQTEASRRAPVVVDQACGEEGKKEFVSLVAQSWYLWYDELAPVSADDYSTAQAYLNAITAPLAPDGRDPGFSYLTTQAADNAQGSTGAYVGYGFSYAFDFQNRFMFSDVLQGGPAGDADFRRGDEVLAIDVGNGFETIAQLSERQATSAEVFGASEAGIQRSFRVRQEQLVVEVTLTKRELVTPPLATEPLLLERSGTTSVGYLNLRSFISTANEALADATRTFRDAGVTDLVIDLRYNGGGLVSVADTMLDLLGGLAAKGEASWRITHNDRHSDEDFGAEFAELADSMSPLRIAFITTGGTASASELVINSLAPHIEVVLIGEDTLAKAVGQYAFD
ncbi:MAG TPA: peptidase S41, partial [Gammaproteobacteria bacterium]|nr:peptidase S41 [Gammaproteobacteria bacterium]